MGHNAKLFNNITVSGTATLSIKRVLKSNILHTWANVGGFLPTLANSQLNILVDGRLCPDGETIISALFVKNETGNIIAFLRTKAFTNDGEHCVNPVLVKNLAARVRDADAPFAACVVLRIFPFGLDTVLKKIVSIPYRDGRGLLQTVKDSEKK